MNQKFKYGDLVRISDSLGASMSHFTSGREAVVVHSYADRYGGDNHTDYSIYIEGEGPVAWYRESQLTLIESNRADRMQEWEDAAAAKKKIESDLDWIFAHGEEVLAGGSWASIGALAECFGLVNLWGPRGEGIDAYQNGLNTLSMASPFLKAGDKAGWLEFCKSVIIPARKGKP